MTARQILLQDIFSQISNAFPSVRIEYQFEQASNTHFIKVTPQETYDSIEFLRFESKLNKQWFESGISVEEDFCIVSDDSLIQLEAPELIYEPSPRLDHIFVSSYNIQETVLVYPKETDFYSFVDTELAPDFADSSYKLAA
ncbi:MAG: hypothetical protein H6605_11120 [Flavobacteriales bacterium]|nr:hypothetical protein [Flavobacteriales bacterium]